MKSLTDINTFGTAVGIWYLWHYFIEKRNRHSFYI